MLVYHVNMRVVLHGLLICMSKLLYCMCVHLSFCMHIWLKALTKHSKLYVFSISIHRPTTERAAERV